MLQFLQGDNYLEPWALAQSAHCSADNHWGHCSILWDTQLLVPTHSHFFCIHSHTHLLSLYSPPLTPITPQCWQRAFPVQATEKGLSCCLPNADLLKHPDAQPSLFSTALPVSLPSPHFCVTLQLSLTSKWTLSFLCVLVPGPRSVKWRPASGSGDPHGDEKWQKEQAKSTNICLEHWGEGWCLGSSWSKQPARIETVGGFLLSFLTEASRWTQCKQEEIISK